MLTIYRRHTRTCAHRSEGRKYRRCRCPIWTDGFIGRDEIRRSLDTRDWEKAQGIIREWEAEGERTPEPEKDEPTTIGEAWTRFVADSKARGLREPTIRKYEHLKRQMERFGQDQGLRYIAEFNVDNLTTFRVTWPNQNLSALKKLELLRTFFRFCDDRNWISGNPARKIKNPKITDRPTMPFAREEQLEILRALESFKHSPSRRERRLRALILLLRYSGLRISDAVTLSRDRINAGKLFLYTSKAGTPVFCPLPDIVTEALDSAAPTSEPWFFWTGQSKSKTAISHWTIELKHLLKKGEDQRRSRPPLPGHVRGRAVAGQRSNGQGLGVAAIEAFESQKSTTRRGYAPAKSNWKPTFGARGPRGFPRRRVHQRYTDNTLQLTD
jgi:integrase